MMRRIAAIGATAPPARWALSDIIKRLTRTRGGCTVTLIRATTLVMLLGAGLPTTTPEAEDASVKAGKWEFSIAALSRSGCISAENPLPPMARGPAEPADANHPCKVITPEVNGAAVSWSTICTTDKATITEEWIVHYHGETLDGAFRQSRGRYP
jgi:hypothetical protein